MKRVGWIRLISFCLLLAMILLTGVSCGNAEKNSDATGDQTPMETPDTPDEKPEENKEPVTDTLDFNVMSFNIRYMTSSDTGTQAWDVRKEVVLGFILDKKASIVCMQEVVPAQQKDLTEALSKRYNMIWYGRDAMDDKTGEGLAIAYDTRDWELVEQGRFWLSETPEQVSKGWGAALNRICVTAVLEHRSTGVRIAVYNVHLDHKSDEARTNGIQLVLDRIGQCEYPVYLCGDFNATRESNAYQKVSAVMNDGQLNASRTESGTTYTNWGEKTAADEYVIDYNFFSKQAFELVSFDICEDKWGSNKQNHLSDHNPIVSEVKLTYVVK